MLSNHGVKKNKTEGDAERERGTGGGRKSKLGEEEQVCLVLFWYKYALPFWILGLIVGLDESNVQRLISSLREFIEEAADPELKERLEKKTEGRINIDATEQKVRRPSRKQKCYYSGKKKLHTMKTQIADEVETGLIMDVSDSCPGSVHDYTLFKRSRVTELIVEEVGANMDSGYQGVKTDYPQLKSRTPIKRKKGEKLTRKEKKHNRELSRERVAVENTISKIKKYSVLNQTYRFKRGNYNQDFRNVASLINFRILFPEETFQLVLISQ